MSDPQLVPEQDVPVIVITQEPVTPTLVVVPDADLATLVITPESDTSQLAVIAPDLPTLVITEQSVTTTNLIEEVGPILGVVDGFGPQGVPGPSGGVGGPGPTGPSGPTGLTGPAGESTNGSHRHVQDVPSADWVIVHNLGFYPGGTTVVDSAGSGVEGDIEYTGTSSLTLHFSAPFAGTANLS